MKEIVSSTKVFNISRFSEAISTIVWQLLATVLGFFMAKTSLWGGISPLGAAAVAGAPIKYMLSCALGATVGYIVPFSNISGFKFIAGIIAIVAIRLILNGLKIGRNAVFSAITAAVVMLGVNFAAASSRATDNIVLGIAEGLLSGGGAYFIRRATAIKYGSSAGLSSEQIASTVISMSLVLTALFPVQVDGISLGRIISFVILLFAARYGRAGIASICGVAIAIAICLSGGNSSYALVICFSALGAGVFASLGKLPTVSVPASASALWILVSSASKESVAMFVETLIAGFVFLIIPRTLSSKIGAYIIPPVTTPDTEGLRKTLTMRLSFASAALQGVSETVEDVARCLAISKKPSFAAVLHKVENDACKGCTFMLYCWEKQRKTTVDAVLAMSEAVRRCQPINLAQVPQQFSEKCLRIEKFEDSVVRNYSEYLSNVAAEKRVSEMRDVMSDQMNGIASMLCELSNEFKTAHKYDVAMAGRVAVALKELDLRADECSCVVDKFGRMTVEIKLMEIPEIPINRARVLSRIEQVCDRDFEAPEINRVGHTYYITATEKAIYSVDCYCTQFNQGKNQLCGDTCRYFFDGRGRLIAIVSDGMGSGGRAAVDSCVTAGLAERLLKAGFGYDCTLRLVNSAMQFKSTDESLATLDISCIDLFSGKTELFKAGAAPTIVRRNGRMGRAECKSLPTGILHDVGFDKATVTLKEDDILIMMSDGVCTEGTDWICAEVEGWQGGNAKQLSERLATAARRRRRDGHDDDITVFAAIIEKAV